MSITSTYNCEVLLSSVGWKAEHLALLRPFGSELKGHLRTSCELLSLWIGAICASSRIEFAWRATTYCALGQAGWPPHPPTSLATQPLEA
jgi:hypothetical protein